MKESEKVYWIKAVLGLATGLITFYINSSLGFQGEIALMAGTVLYIAYSEAAAMMFNVDRDRTIKIGMGAFLFLWMLSWTLLNTMGTYGWI
ncbi:MAG: hypothetical protein ABUK18_04805 [Candidatus Bathyarchaeia archaeon]|nr:MAG: hypothetical protein DRO27_02490 [Candidatus Bathyarchaeota archaeon]